jgi:hypothetical protein
MQNRKRHCTFAKLNRSGRCIADCYENRERNFDTDCTGHAGLTFDYEGEHEVRISSGFVDGRNAIIIDGKIQLPKPTAPPVPKTSDEVPYKSYGWGTYIDENGKVFKFDVAGGTKVRRYIT